MEIKGCKLSRDGLKKFNVKLPRANYHPVPPWSVQKVLGDTVMVKEIDV